ncbi:MAG: hypothetical protein V7785_16325 [Bermanella sp.]
MRYAIAFIFTILHILPCHSEGGYVGVGTAFNSSATFDKQDAGLLIQWGATITDGIDLEWGLVDFGKSYYDDPTFIAPDLTDDDEGNDSAQFENLGYGDASSAGGGSYKGISNIHTLGLSAGLKFKKRVNNWMQVFARASFLGWQAKTSMVEIYGPTEVQYATVDADGDALPNGDTSIISNYNPCGNLGFCRALEEDGKTHYAVDFWYGYGLIARPYKWLALRAEYSITTLNAVNFPKATLEGFSTSVEIHY